MGAIVTAAGLALMCFVLAMVFAIIKKIHHGFRRAHHVSASGKMPGGVEGIYGLLSAHPGQFALYLLFSIVLAMAIGMIVMIVLLVTCCVCCLALLPYVGTVLLLPALIFKRAYSLYYLAQCGPQHDVFPPPSAPPVAGTSPLPV